MTRSATAGSGQAILQDASQGPNVDFLCVGNPPALLWALIPGVHVLGQAGEPGKNGREQREIAYECINRKGRPIDRLTDQSKRRQARWRQTKMILRGGRRWQQLCQSALPPRGMHASSVRTQFGLQLQAGMPARPWSCRTPRSGVHAPARGTDIGVPQGVLHVRPSIRPAFWSSTRAQPMSPSRTVPSSWMNTLADLTSLPAGGAGGGRGRMRKLRAKKMI